MNPLDYAYDTLNMQTTFDKQGHRGCRGLMPENTIPAMLHALDLNVTTLELDVVITKDKQVLLSHEPFFNHEISTITYGTYANPAITDANEKSFNVFQMTYEEMKRFDVGLKPHPRFPQQKKIAANKPLLRDLFDSIAVYMQSHKRPQPFFNIETKCLPATDGIFHPKPQEFVELLMTVIKEKKMEQWVIIQSFDFRTLQYLHQHYPNIKTAMLIEDDDKRGIEIQIEALGFMPTIYSPHYSLVNVELIKYCHEKNIKVIPWTVNTKEEIEQLKKLGVDGIISDYPDLF
ncbi:glycerophosphodiester phosphodiesterase [Lacibacter luteus]|uniref:Glycerophosphodiester phosphodiesterase n=1 Tax=Lacibacter luteus TaxID=2508719 RepID=A0A4Q1CMN3_9BACT|nr:glycerophosphodiester phosphodiesterase family protein [Lacibacter luteus]RXK62303.1 glycerophosphodiester phosphodiesterase [Lacibacter luteus]